MTRIAKTHLIIHAFALAHALFCMWFYGTAIGTTPVLTILTIAMAVFVVKLYNTPVEMIVALLFLTYLAGLVLGSKMIGPTVRQILSSVPPIMVHTITTTIVTEILGWSLFFVVRRRADVSKH